MEMCGSDENSITSFWPCILLYWLNSTITAPGALAVTLICCIFPTLPSEQVVLRGLLLASRIY